MVGMDLFLRSVGISRYRCVQVFVSSIIVDSRCRTH